MPVVQPRLKTQLLLPTKPLSVFRKKVLLLMVLPLLYTNSTLKPKRRPEKVSLDKLKMTMVHSLFQKLNLLLNTPCLMPMVFTETKFPGIFQQALFA